MELKKTGHPIVGIGIGISGLVNPFEGVIKYSIPLKVTKDFNFFKEISDLIDIPMYIENDANCCSWGELVFHKEQRLKNFIFVLVEFRNADNLHSTYSGLAVGMGIVIDGRVYYGNDLTAGEFQSIFRQSFSCGQFSLTEDEMLKVNQDDKLFTKFSEELSKNLALMINTFNLSHVFLGGDIEKNKTIFVTILKDQIQNNWSYPFKVNCDIRFSSMDKKAVAYGAAGMILNRLFTDQEILDNKIGMNLLVI
jgi:predicted NBD/HSP70 family sugar kinase